MKPRIVGTDNIQFKGIHKGMAFGKHNGAYYYSKEIEQNIIPNVATDRPWDTLGMRGVGSQDRAIVFLHHNLDPDKTYDWLKRYRDLVLVVSNKEVYKWAKSVGYKVIFLPLSVDVEYVEKFKTKKTKNACYAGNKWKFKEKDLTKYIPDGVDFPPADLERDKLLEFIAPYKRCYCIGRCAIEARILGCEILKCDHRYEPEDFFILDNKDAAKILQKYLNKIDNLK